VLGACASAARPESIRSSSIATPPGAIAGAHGEEHELRVAAMAISSAVIRSCRGVSFIESKFRSNAVDKCGPADHLTLLTNQYPFEIRVLLPCLQRPTQ